MGSVSRRSTRTFTEDETAAVAGNSQIVSYELLCKTPLDQTDRQPLRDQKTLPLVVLEDDIRIDLRDVLHSTSHEMGKNGIVKKSLQQATDRAAKVKEDGRPLNFGIVESGKMYRSSMPLVEDFPYLQTLGLKTILSLVKKDFSPEFQDFMRKNNIRHQVIDMPGTKKAPITDNLMFAIMETVLDKENYPILVHCNHGKHRSGCVVAVARHATGWDVDAIVEEYREFAAPKIRECDVKYITAFKVGILQPFVADRDVHPRTSALTTSKMTRMLFVTIVILAIWFTSLAWL